MKGRWKLGFKNLLRNRRRTLATGLSIAVGFAGIAFTLGYILDIERFLRVAHVYLLHNGHLSIYKKDGLERYAVRPLEYSLTAEDQARIDAVLRAEPDVDRAMPYLVGTGLLSNGCQTVPYRVLGVKPDDLRWSRAQPLVSSATPELLPPLRGRPVWGVGQPEGGVALAKRLAWRIGKERVFDEVGAGEAGVLDCQAPDLRARVARDANVQLVTGTFGGDFTALDAEVVSIYTSGFSEFEDTQILAPLPWVQTLYDTDRVTYYAVFLKSTGGLEARADALQRKLEAAGLEVEVYPWNVEALSPTYTSVIQLLKVLGSFIVAVLLLVVGLSIVNSITIALIERTRELGTLRALGFTPRHLRKLLLSEITLLAVFATGVGLLLAVAAAGGLDAADVRIQAPQVAGNIQFRVQLTWWLCLGIAGLVAGVAAFSTLVASRPRLRQKIVEML